MDLRNFSGKRADPWCHVLLDSVGIASRTHSKFDTKGGVVHEILLWVGRGAGLLGALVSLAAVVVRLYGHWHLFGMSVGTVLQGGVAAMVMGCLGYLASIAEHGRYTPPPA